MNNFAVVGNSLDSHAVRPKLYVALTGLDTNPGTFASPKLTIRGASLIATPGTIVYVADGNYPGGFTTNTSGTAANRISYVSTNLWGAKLIGGANPPVGGESACWTEYASYTDIIGFEVDGTGANATGYTIGLYLGGSFGLLYKCKIHDILSDVTTYNAKEAATIGGAGILLDYYYGGTDNVADSCISYHIGPSGATGTHTHGISCTGLNGIIRNCLIYGAPSGIETWHGANAVHVLNNTVDNTTSLGIVVGSGDAGGTASTGNNFIVSNNIFSNNTAGGIQEHGTTGTNNYYRNNLIFNSPPATYILTGHAPTGTVTSDPLYVNASTGNYHLQSGSPARAMAYAADAQPLDLNGAQRTAAQLTDVGCLPYGAA